MRLAGLAALAAVALAGCGEERIDTERLERELERQIESQTSVQVGAVECPEDVEVSEQGFECTVRGATGGQVQVPVAQDGDGNVSFRTPDLRALTPRPSAGDE